MNESQNPAPRVAAARWQLGGAFVALFALTVLLQWRNNAYTNEFGSHADEAGHYVTGLLVYDFVRSLDWMHPGRFAETYYVHYPKIGLGHWGPGFYVLQALWELAFGVSRTSLMLMMAAITALVSTTLYWLCTSVLPRPAALGLAAMLPATNVFRYLTAMLMADPLCALFVLWATVAWAWYLVRPSARSASLFGACAVLAILTKASALLLALLPLISVLLLRDFRLIANPSFWLPALIVALGCGPWYVATRHMQSDGLVAEWFSAAFAQHALQVFTRGSFTVFGAGTLMVAGIGCFRGPRGEEQRGLAVALRPAMLSLLISTLIFHSTVPAGLELRYLAIVAPVVLFLAANGAAWLTDISPRMGVWKTAVATVTAALVLWSTTHTRTYGGVWPTAGYGHVAADLEIARSGDGGAFLVASDVLGDGMFVAQIAMRDTRPNRFALRASKLLASSSWLGEDHRLRFSTLQELQNCLQSLGVAALVLDRSPDATALPENEQLRQLVEAYPDDWQRTAQYPLRRFGRPYPQAIEVYQSRHVEKRPVSEVEEALHRLMGRKLQLAVRRSRDASKTKDGTPDHTLQSTEL